MAYIWGRSKAPDYLTGIYDPKYIDKGVASNLVSGTKINEKYLMFCIETGRVVNKENFFQWDILSNTLGVPLVNQKVLDILERECRGKFQAIPAILKLPSGEEVKDFFAINVTNKVNLLSLENSILSAREKERNEPIGPWTFFDQAAYKANIVDAQDISKDSTILGRTIFISDRLVKIFKKEKIKGPQFWKNLRDSVILV